MVIIKSNKQNWEGKSFDSESPAKIYNNFKDAVEAIESYHFWEYDNKRGEFVEVEKMQKIEFIFLAEKRKDILLKRGLVRF